MVNRKNRVAATDEFVLEDSTVEEDYRMTAALEWFINLNLNFPEQIKIELIFCFRHVLMKSTHHQKNRKRSFFSNALWGMDFVWTL